MTRLVLVRHGESAWNAERRIQGQGGTGLSEFGAVQAGATADALLRLYPDAQLVSSDLQRCLETARPLCDRLGVEALLEPGLRERHFGAWSGLLVTEVAERDPQRWQRWRDGEDVVAEIGGEDTPTLVARVLATLERLAASAAAPVVCVTHGGPVWHGTHALLGVSPILGGVGNCSITELEVDAAGTRLISWNQVAHLPAPPLASLTGTVRSEPDAPPMGT